MLIFRVEIIYTFLADGAASFGMFCHLDIPVSCSVVLLFIEVDGNVVSVNFVSAYILNIHLLIYYIAYKDIQSIILMFMEEYNFLKNCLLSSSLLHE